MKLQKWHKLFLYDFSPIQWLDFFSSIRTKKLTPVSIIWYESIGASKFPEYPSQQISFQNWNQRGYLFQEVSAHSNPQQRTSFCRLQSYCRLQLWHRHLQHWVQPNWWHLAHDYLLSLPYFSHLWHVHLFLYPLLRCPFMRLLLERWHLSHLPYAHNLLGCTDCSWNFSLHICRFFTIFSLLRCWRDRLH